MKPELLVVEDDIFLRDGLCEMLTREGYSVHCAGSCREARRRATENSYRLIILDIMLPDGSGLELCSAWRSGGLETPILFLTARDEEVQIVRGLDAGGDDYVTKPFRLAELLSRLRALLRRKQPEARIHEGSGLSIDLQAMNVLLNDQKVFLTPTEFQLLSVLVRHAGQVVTRTLLLQTIWDSEGLYIDDNTLSVHISRLREKIGNSFIETARGVGYRWAGGK